MGLKKGMTNNKNGRPKGVPNKISSEIREVYKELIENNLCNIDVWLEKVANDNPDKALSFIMKLSEYVIPRLQSTEFTSDLNKLSDNQLDVIINNLKANINNDKTAKN